ncbi:hypothetical protein MMC25_008012 [Agyrium rufum]|nr:hypothetical protein [Agyrium rufum]
MTIGVGIIGGGIFAREEHAPAVEASVHLTLKAVYSRSLKSAKTVAPDASNVDFYSDDSGEGKSFEDLLKRDDIGAVIIALPILNQPEYIKASLKAGKHVLSEKPVAENVKDAQELIKWYHANINEDVVHWSVAENFRYLNSFDYAQSEIEKLGKVLGFRLAMYANVLGGKYFDTLWRKKPSHQGGFLLDGGVHFVAGLRLLLGSDSIVRLAAFTNQLREYLPPVDTIDATLKIKSGATGALSVSFGTTMTGSVWTVGCEGGSVSVSGTTVIGMAKGSKVSVSGSTITTTIDGKEEKKSVEDERSGVPPEVRKWGEALTAGKENPRQTPEEALADLEVVEKLLRSGEQNGTPLDCVLQDVAPVYGGKPE